MSGNGYAYGLELFAQKSSGKWNGWASYTLSWNYRQFEEINRGEVFPYRYDRRHNLNIFVSYLLPGKKADRSFSATWMYITGARATVPTSVYGTPTDLPNLSGGVDNILTIQNLYEFYDWALYSPSRNNIQMRDFHKLDIAYEKSVTTRKGNIKKWGTGMYNVYGNRNPYYLLYTREHITIYPSGYQYIRAGVQEYSFLAWIPYLNYSLTF